MFLLWFLYKNIDSIRPCELWALKIECSHLKKKRSNLVKANIKINNGILERRYTQEVICSVLLPAVPRFLGSVTVTWSPENCKNCASSHYRLKSHSDVCVSCVDIPSLVYVFSAESHLRTSISDTH